MESDPIVSDSMESDPTGSDSMESDPMGSEYRTPGLFGSRNEATAGPRSYQSSLELPKELRVRVSFPELTGRIYTPQVEPLGTLGCLTGAP